jgi:hypothetical protein
MKAWTLGWTVALVALVALAWAAPVWAQEAPAVRVDHVVVVSIDGLRPDALARFRTPTLARLVERGSATMEASTILPSKTLPSHVSMLTGVGPDIHGITWNLYIGRRGVVAVPTVFELARSRGLGVAAFYAKAKLRHLDRPGSYDHRLAPRWNVDNWLVTDLIPEAVAYIRHRRPNLVFIHIGEPDVAGHVGGG